MKHNRGELTTYFSAGCCRSNWGDIFQSVFLLLFYVVCVSFPLLLFTSAIQHLAPPLAPTHHMQNFKRQDQNNLHHTGNYRQWKMSHIVTARFFSRAKWIKVGLASNCLQQGTESRFGDMKQPVMFGRLCGHFVSLSGPHPHAVLDFLPTMYQNQ